MSGNDYLGACTLPLSELMADAPKPGANGLYEEGVDGKHDSREFRVSLTVAFITIQMLGVLSGGFIRPRWAEGTAAHRH